MVVISKLLFDTKIRPEATCKNVFHPWTNNCAKANLTYVVRVLGSGVFNLYVSIYLVKLLANQKKINKTYLKKIAMKFLRSWCFGVSYGGLALAGICLNFNILGRFHYHTVGLVPGFLSGLTLLLEDSGNRSLNTLLWSSLVIEALLKNLYHFQVLNYSVFRETLVFMIMSSLLMHRMIKRTLNGKKLPPTFWFYIPSSQKVCTLKNYFAEIIKYFGLGYGFSSARSLISGVLHKHSIKVLFKEFLNLNHAKFGMVLGTYAALFKGSLLLLQKCNFYDATTNAALAGFIAGISYRIKPTTNILAISIVTVLQNLLKDFFKASKSVKLTLTMLIYIFSNGILFQNRVLAPITCPKYFSNMLKIASHGLLNDVARSLINKYLNT